MKKEEKRTQCLNCGNTYEGNYCPQCGQAAKTKRLRLIEMVNNFIGSFVGGDNKFLNTVRDLICRPGYMVKDYLLGKRIRYYNPLQMYVFMLTIYAVISFVIGDAGSVLDEMTTIDVEKDLEPSEYASVDFIFKLVAEIGSNKLYGIIFFALIAVLPCRWLFRKDKIERHDGRQLALNYTEQFCAQMYHSCVTLTVSTLMLPLCLIPGSDGVVGTIYQLISFVYIVVLYRQLLGIKWWRSIVLNLVAMILTILIFAMVLLAIAVPIGVAEGLKG